MNTSSLQSPTESSAISRDLDATDHPAVVSEILALHGEIITAARTSLDKAIRIGELLTNIKADLKHGQWLPWVEANVPFDRTTAFRYMRCFDQREMLQGATFELIDAYQLLAAPAEPEGPRSWFARAKALEAREVSLYARAQEFFGKAEERLSDPNLILNGAAEIANAACDWAYEIHLHREDVKRDMKELLAELEASSELSPFLNAVFGTNKNWDLIPQELVLRMIIKFGIKEREAAA